MREYKHRGKCINEGELKGKWVYGDLLQKNGKYYITPHANAVNVQGNLGKIIVMHEVDPETVGQYTGLPDKNGIEIYKGDVWLYHGVGYHVCWHEDEAKFYFKHPSLHAGDDDHIDLGWSSHGEIIGDIIDNPELLEG